MALSENKVSVQNFTGGLITDYHELNTPQNVSVDEQNCDLDRQGFRKRRLGMAYETSYTQNATQYAATAMGTQYIGKYQWKQVGNNANLNFLVVQTGADLTFYDAAAVPVSSGLKSFTVSLNTYAVPGAGDVTLQGISTASGNGALFVVGALINPFYITYNAAKDTITVQTINIQIRDLIEQDASASNDALLATVTPGRLYDLYNQGWNTSNVRLYYSNVGPTIEAGATTVLSYYLQVKHVYPPKTAPWWVGKRIGDKGVEVFDPQQWNTVASGNTLTALGHYIYNAFSIDRSTTSGIAGIPVQTTTLRPSAVAFFAGKLFYAFGNTLYYSQTITDTSDMSGVGKCYMDADPTSEQINNLVATDGGTIPITDSANPVALFVIENSLVLFATNGLWIISGSSTNSGFSATDYSVNKISDVPCVSSRSIINADGVPIWWAPQGIFTLKPASVKQSFEVENISFKKIQNLYDTIVPMAKVNATGSYDHIMKRAIWLYNGSASVDSVTDRFYYNNVLIIDLVFGAFLTYTVSDLTNSQTSKLVDVFNIQSIQTQTSSVNVTDGSNNIVVDKSSNDVTVNASILFNSAAVTSDIMYIAVGPVPLDTPTGSSPMTVAFGNFTGTDFHDWSDYTNTTLKGANYTSYLDAFYTIAGYMTPHFTPAYDSMLWMYSPYVYVFLKNQSREIITTVTTIPGAAVVPSGMSIMAYQNADGLDDSHFGTVLPDWANGNLYSLDVFPGTTNEIIRRFDLYPNGVEAAHTTTGTLGITGLPSQNTACAVTYSGHLVFPTSASNSATIAEVDGATLTLVSTVGVASSAVAPATPTSIPLPYSMAPIRYGTTDIVLSACNFSVEGTPDACELCYLPTPNLTIKRMGVIDEKVGVLGRGAVNVNFGTAFVIGRPKPTSLPTTTAISLYKITATNGSVTFAKSGTFLPAQVDAAWTHISNVSAPAFDQVDGNVIVLVQTTDAVTHTTYFIKLNATTGAIIWALPIVLGSWDNSADNMGKWNIANQTILYLNDAHLLYTINTSAGTATTQTLNTLAANLQFSDDATNSILLNGSWAEGTTHPAYIGNYMGALGNHTFGSDSIGRFFLGTVVGQTRTGTTLTTYQGPNLTTGSSCLLQTAWDWASSAASKKWAQQVETYKYRANFFVDVSKNKVRGKGRAMQLRFSSTEGKDFQLIGWGIWYTKNQRP